MGKRVKKCCSELGCLSVLLFRKLGAGTPQPAPSFQGLLVAGLQMQITLAITHKSETPGWRGCLQLSS